MWWGTGTGWYLGSFLANLYSCISQLGVVGSTANLLRWVLHKDSLSKNTNSYIFRLYFKENFNNLISSLFFLIMDNLWYATLTFNKWNKISIHRNLPFTILFKLPKAKATVKINIAYSNSIPDQEQHMHQYTCIQSALLLNISLLQSETLRQKNGRQFPGPRVRKRTLKKTLKSKPPRLQSLVNSCLSGVYILQGLEKLEQLKTKASIHL